MNFRYSTLLFAREDRQRLGFYVARAKIGGLKAKKMGVRQAVAGGRPVPSHHRGLDCAAYRIRGGPLYSPPPDHCPRKCAAFSAALIAPEALPARFQRHLCDLHEGNRIRTAAPFSGCPVAANLFSPFTNLLGRRRIVWARSTSSISSSGAGYVNHESCSFGGDNALADCGWPGVEPRDPKGKFRAD